jgi:hypothetical protein
MSEPDNLIPCEVCGTLIEHLRVQSAGIFSTVCKFTLCLACQYQENFRTNRLARKPYRDPFPRPRADGSMPVELQQELEAHYLAQKYRAWRDRDG